MSQTQANLVEVRGIRFSRGDRVIFDDISLSVPRGKITAIMGPSGIGKTTLLRLIGGQIPPDRGEILFDGENVPQMTRSRLYTVRKRMSMLFQSGALFTDLNVFDNVAYPLREHTQLPPALLHTPALKELQREFGDTILDDYGNLRRHTLANLAFSSLEKTKRLNEITHPHILRKMKENIEECRQKRKKVVVLDAPLLFEAGLERICTVTLAVLAPREQRLQRVMARDSITREEAEKRMSAQQQDQYYKDRSDYVLVNQETSGALYYQTRRLLQRLREEHNV